MSTVSQTSTDELDEAALVLDDLATAGVAVEVVDGRLRLSPASAVDAALRGRVADHKAGILALLADRIDAVKLWRQTLELVAESLKLPPDVLEAARPSHDRRGDNETPDEGRRRQAEAIERLRLDRLAFIDDARRAGVYRGIATDTGEGVA